MNCYIFFLIFILTDASLDLPSCWGMFTFHTVNLFFKHMNIFWWNYVSFSVRDLFAEHLIISCQSSHGSIKEWSSELLN